MDLYMNSETIIKISSDYISKRRANGDVLLICIDDSELYYTIDGMAADLWEKLAKGVSIEKAQGELIAKFPKEEAEIKKLIKGFIADLTKNKIITKSKN